MKLELSNLQTFCRTCLDCLKSSVDNSQTSSVKNYDIRKTPDLTKMLIICTALNINDDVDMMYPQRICSKCYHTLLDFKRFREVAIKSQEVFHGIVENADGEFIAENVDAEKRSHEKSEYATTENTDRHFDGSEPKLYYANSKDETEPANGTLINKNREVENVMLENHAPDLYVDQTGNSTDIDVHRSAVGDDINASSSKIADKKKLITVRFVKAANGETTYTTAISPFRLKLNKIKAKLISGDFTINERSGRSKVWSIFGTIKKETGEMIPGVVACRSCLNIYKKHEKCTSNLVRHKCYQDSVEMHGPDADDIVLKNADGELIAENVDAEKRFSEKSKDATAENTDKHLKVSKPKLSDSYYAISADDTDTSASSSKIANKRKRSAENDNEELFQSTDSHYEQAVTKKKTYTTKTPLKFKLNKIKAKIINGDFTINEKRGRSKLWNIFGTIKKDTGEIISGVVACKSCLNIYKCNEKCTSNLVRHKCYKNAGEMYSSNADEVYSSNADDLALIEDFRLWWGKRTGPRVRKKSFYIKNAGGELIAENVDAEKRSSEKSEDATAENTDKHLEVSIPKLSDSYYVISGDDTEPDNVVLINKKREIKNAMPENDSPDLSVNQTGNSTDIDVGGTAVCADTNTSSSKLANKRKRIADNENEERFQSTESHYEDVYNSNENLHKHLKENEAIFAEETTYTSVINSLYSNEIKDKIKDKSYCRMNEVITFNLARHKCYDSYSFQNVKMDGDTMPNEKSNLVEYKCSSSQTAVGMDDDIVLRLKEKSTSNLVQYKCSSCQNAVEMDRDIVPRFKQNSTSNLVQYKCSSSQTAEMDGDIVLRFKEKSTSNLVQYKWLNCQNAVEMDGDIVPKICVDSECKKRGIRAFTQWSLENCRSYQIANDSAFRNIAQYFISIGAKYGQNVDIASTLPHPTTISCNVSNIYGIIFEKVKSQINLIRDIGFGLTSDIWTDHYLRKSYIALTMHYIKEGSLFTRLIGLQLMDGERCTHKNIQETVRDMLMAFNCDLNDNAIIVTDRGSNMVEAFRSFHNIFCINHLINNALQNTIEEVSALEELCGQCSKLVKYFNKSGINLSVQSTLKSYCRTHWNTTYYLLRLIQQNWVEINQTLQEKNEQLRINKINLTQLQGIITILEPFEESLKKLEGEHYPTIHLTLMHINRLVKKCSPESTDHTMVKEFKKRLRINLESTVIKNLTVYHKVALFLFPPANKMIQFDKGDKQLVKDKCKLMMRAYQTEIPVQRQGHKLMQLSGSNQELVADYIKSTEDINGDLALDYELIMYEKNNVAFHDDFNILHWWYQNKTEFPLLFKVSCKILATPTSIAPSERIFSLARNLISENMNINANINSVNEIMFVNVNIERDNILGELNSII